MVQTNKIEDVDKNIPDASNLVTKTALNRKIVHAENKIPDVS